MKNSENLTEPTIVLNKDDFDGFLDLNSSDLSDVMKILNIIMNE